MECIVATHNHGKMAEIAALLSPISVRSLSNIGLNFTPVEDGATFKENAIIKAKTSAEAMRAAGLPEADTAILLADDSGLEIDALNKQPGVYSARYLGEDTPYSVKNQHILDLLKDVPDERRTARFVCVIACVWPDGRIETAEGVVEGRIAYAIRGENGFGYDPIFWLPAYGQTTAELEPDEKNRISHRGKALRMMQSILQSDAAVL